MYLHSLFTLFKDILVLNMKNQLTDHAESNYSNTRMSYFKSDNDNNNEIIISAADNDNLRRNTDYKGTAKYLLISEDPILTVNLEAVNDEYLALMLLECFWDIMLVTH